MTVVLLAGAGLLGKSFYRLLHIELGFRPDHLATLSISGSRRSYGSDEASGRMDRLVIEKAAAVPGVEAAALTTMLPVTMNGNTIWIRFIGRPYDGRHNEVLHREVTPDYFHTLGATLLSGRNFGPGDRMGTPGVAIINQALARQYFPGQDPVGQRIGDADLTPKSIVEVVGVVKDFQEGPLDSNVWPAIYYPLDQETSNDISLVARSSQDPATLLPALADAVHGVDRDLGVTQETTMATRIQSSQTAYLHRSAAWLVGGFAAMALVLSVVGLYGVIAYSVSQRTREIGVRMALGAQRVTVYRLILQEAIRLAALGIAAGLLCSVLAMSLLGRLLFQVRAWDLPTLAAVAGVLGAAALLASYLPARRAASVNPVEALRAE